MESYCSLCTFKVPQGTNNLILCTLDTIHRLFFVTRLIINKINKVQWVDFKLENVLVSLHSFFLRNGELLGHSPIRSCIYNYLCNQFLSPLKLWVRTRSWWGVLDRTLCDQFCLWLGTGFLPVLRFPPPINLTALI